MTDIFHLVEDFGSALPKSVVETDEEEIESNRLDAFEDGYKAGWDDAVQAHANDKKRISAELAQNLMDMSFTFNEAHSQLTRSLRPLLTEIVEKVLPETMRSTIGQRVVEELQKLADGSLNGESVVMVAPDNFDAVKAMLEDHDNTQATVREDASLSNGQVHLAIANHEVELNLSGVIAEMAELIEAFYNEQNEGNRYERQQAV